MDVAAGFSFSTAVSHNFSPIPSPSASASSFSGSLPSSPPLTPGVYSLLSPHHPYATQSSSPCRPTTPSSSSSSSSWPFRGFEAAPFRGAIQTYDEVFRGFTTRKAARATTEYSTDTKADTDTNTDTYTDTDTGMGTETGTDAGTETESVPEGVKKSYYSLLGVQKSASSADIRQAYRTLALKLHPDVSPLHQLDTTTRLFAQINEAYAVLSDTHARARYDLKLALESPSSSPAIHYRNEKMKRSPVTSPRAYPPCESFYRTHRSGTKNWETDQCWG